MIKFKDIFWQNLLSTGNAGTKVQLDGAPTTLIIGKNGNGKSTLLDALCFALYGKPFRNITKSQLVNSINLKQCKVVINFETEGKEYRVVRGIKPNIFEIYQDGTLITQDAAIKDYQKVLEKQILKMNMKTFTQVVILGSSSFTPFMKLPAGHRREVIEDILDTVIFSVMNTVLKDKVSETKSELLEIGNKLTALKGQVASQHSLIEVMKKSKTDATDEINKKIDNNDRRIEALDRDVEILDKQIDDTTNEIAEISATLRAGQGTVDSLAKSKESHKTLVVEKDFYQTHDECPTCKQGISPDFCSTKIHDLTHDISSTEVTIETLQKEVDDLKAKARVLQSRNDVLQQLKIDRSGIVSEIKSIRAQTQDYRDQLNSVAADTGDIDKEKQKLKDLAAEGTRLLEDKVEKTELRGVQDVSLIMLKDTGIKSNVVREYLPLMNQFINEYLQVQDSFIQFEINEQFEETIKSRYRDEFSYASFSEGERQRIDLAILFTWRKIAKLKNSANTNLLVLDEIMDGSLDVEGNDSAQALIDMLAADGTHVFVVSHSVDKHIENFDRVLEFTKKNNYSVMAELK